MAFNFDAVLERKKDREKKQKKEKDVGGKKAVPKALFEQFENAAGDDGDKSKGKEREQGATPAKAQGLPEDGAGGGGGAQAKESGDQGRASDGGDDGVGNDDGGGGNDDDEEGVEVNR